MRKGTNIISELSGFFKENDENRAIYSIMNVLNHIRINEKQIGVHKNPNCKMTIKQVFSLLVIFPFFMVKNPNNYAKSALSSMFDCHRNMLYRFMQLDNIDWRRIIYSINSQIWKTIRNKVGAEEYTGRIRTLIIDDTDLEKTGTHIEAIGKVFSHVKMKQVLGFKGLFACFSDGKTQSMIDMSLHGEEGKDKTPKRKGNRGPKPKRYNIADGSGLSLYNYVSPMLEVMFLRYAYRNENIYPHLLHALPIAGFDGTLKSRMKRTDAFENVRAKTGTVTCVSSLAGYCTAQNGHRLCFSIINQGVIHSSNARHFQDRVCNAMCQ